MQDIETADLKHISELIFRRYNYDFRNYALPSLKRRVSRILELKSLSINELLQRLTDQPEFIDEFIGDLTVNVTEMFRDPTSWKIIKNEVIPAIQSSKDKIKIWHAGCSTGEEVLTMCVILDEIGALPNVSITATDIDTKNILKARAGIYPFKNMPVNESNYQTYGGDGLAMKKHYQQLDGSVVFSTDLLRHVEFFSHDLVTGDVFDEFDLILCRNVMIYFNQSLQSDVLKKFHRSLSVNGFLSIGSKESLMWCDYANRFMSLNSDDKIFRKVK